MDKIQVIVVIRNENNYFSQLCYVSTKHEMNYFDNLIKIKIWVIEANVLH